MYTEIEHKSREPHPSCVRACYSVLLVLQLIQPSSALSLSEHAPKEGLLKEAARERGAASSHTQNEDLFMFTTI